MDAVLEAPDTDRKPKRLYKDSRVVITGLFGQAAFLKTGVIVSLLKKTGQVVVRLDHTFDVVLAKIEQVTDEKEFEKYPRLHEQAHFAKAAHEDELKDYVLNADKREREVYITARKKPADPFTSDTLNGRRRFFAGHRGMIEIENERFPGQTLPNVRVNCSTTGPMSVEDAQEFVKALTQAIDEAAMIRTDQELAAGIEGM